MRGPGYRHDLDVRRLWRCAQCGKQRRLAGDITAITCACGQPMQLDEPQRRARFSMQPLVTRELTVASFELTEEELARPVTRVVPPAPDPATEGPHGRPARRPRRGPMRNDQPAEAVPEAAGEPEPHEVSEPPREPDRDEFGSGLEPEA